ncbi:hypothetical protein QFC22_003325 [Naganishia vaughanmartiniae]|uniref:Uncharacterized protein n=1 Tax=Naganishia vaughanmartiniae TaxID=1424756 RepID=A0ACC2X7H7_9TREE|nr:hypothetical protein QFC22_003325 [Naganishia vaughanmartiniae]
MSVFTSPPSAPSFTSISPGSTSTASSSNNGGGFTNPVYRNLFYILVGVLVIFLLVTLLSYIRSRRRRQIIEAEVSALTSESIPTNTNPARRLGLLVPGMAGYLTERARLASALKGQKKPSKEVPLLWDFVSKESTKEGDHEKLGSDRVGLADIPILINSNGSSQSAIAITPLLPIPPLEPIPISAIKHFPNAMAFRAPKPEVSGETILKEWETDLARGPNVPHGTGGTEQGKVMLGRKRARTRGKSLLEQYPQEHVPPLRLSIECARPRQSSRAAELADQIGNKIFGLPSLPATSRSGDQDIEAQIGSGSGLQAATETGMAQIRSAAIAQPRSTGIISGPDTTRSPTYDRNTSPVPPTIQLMTFVRMPIPEHSRELVGKTTWHLATEEEQEKAVQSEWAGVELGVTEMEVVGDAYLSEGDVWGNAR